MNTIHHIAIICSNKDAALDFYSNKLGFPVIRSNYRPDRDDWKIDLAVNDVTELELFIMKDHPARVSNPEGLRTTPLGIPGGKCGRQGSGAGESWHPLRADPDGHMFIDGYHVGQFAMHLAERIDALKR